MFLYDECDLMVDPTTYEKVICDIDSKIWLEAMQSKMESMYSNRVWTLVDPPDRIVPIRCKWIYKRKTGANGKVQTSTVRLIMQGIILIIICTNSSSKKE